MFRVLSIIIVFNIIMIIICFVSRNRNRKKIKQKKEEWWLSATIVWLAGHTLQLYTQIRDCLMCEISRTTFLFITSQQLLSYFFMCCAKPVMQQSNFFIYGSVLFTCFCKSYSKNVLNFTEIQLYPTGIF